MTGKQFPDQLRMPTPENPLRILMSACLAGVPCGYDGTTYGEYPALLRLLGSDLVKVVRFCPEDFSFGSPREVCDIYGGTGDDVLDGRAKVLTESGTDWTAGMIAASEKMLEIAMLENIELAVLMDISAACGSQVIYNGNRMAENKVYQAGAGVCAAQLRRNGFGVICQRDFASLERLFAAIDPRHVIDLSKTDHHETAWYCDYFKSVTES